MKIGQLLKFYMAMREISVRELAEDIGISAATISRITRGEVCDLATHLKITKWLWGS